MRASWLCSLIVASCCAAAPARAHAQEAINFASVSGTVTDAQGAVVPGARVSARHMETNVTAETVTNMEGRFLSTILAPGHAKVLTTTREPAPAGREE